MKVRSLTAQFQEVPFTAGTVQYSSPGNKNTENKENDVLEEAAEDEYCDTYDKADSTAGVVFLSHLKNAGDDKDRSNQENCPVKHAFLEYSKEHTDHDVKKSRKEFGFFLCCHSNSPLYFFVMCKLYHII